MSKLFTKSFGRPAPASGLTKIAAGLLVSLAPFAAAADDNAVTEAAMSEAAHATIGPGHHQGGSVPVIVIPMTDAETAMHGEGFLIAVPAAVQSAMQRRQPPFVNGRPFFGL